MSFKRREGCREFKCNEHTDSERWGLEYYTRNVRDCKTTCVPKFERDVKAEANEHIVRKWWEGISFDWTMSRNAVCDLCRRSLTCQRIRMPGEQNRNNLCAFTRHDTRVSVRVRRRRSSRAASTSGSSGGWGGPEELATEEASPGGIALTAAVVSVSASRVVCSCAAGSSSFCRGRKTRTQWLLIIMRCAEDYKRLIWIQQVSSGAHAACEIST